MFTLYKICGKFQVLGVVMEFGLILFFVLLFVAGVVLYFLPGLIAGRRKHKYSVLITILNIFLGEKKDEDD